MLDNFWLDGISAFEHGIVMQREMEFDAPECDVETVSVPGRNGDIVYSDGSFKNVKGVATCYCLDRDVSRVVAMVNTWLLKRTLYVRLETLHEPNIFRKARLVRGAKLTQRLNKINAFELEFDCMPQKYFKLGEHGRTFAANSLLYNETAFEALPLITVYGSGSGTLTVGSTTVTLDDCDGVTLDCEKHRATSGTTNMNSSVHGEYPKLSAGANEISFTGGVTSVTVIPRWWTL